MAMMSGASVDSKYFYIKGRMKQRMKESIMRFSYFSVRDEWSQNMVQYLTDNEINPPATPDPVFAFNYNALHLVPSKDYIQKKYNLPDDYIIISFKVCPKVSVDQQWIDEFQAGAKQHGFACVKIPYADADSFGSIEYNVRKVISPLDWYALIKYSQGYVGNNMHPIVVSLHNGGPSYSFDNYGISVINGKATNGESSKIYQILKAANLEYNRVFVGNPNYIVPKALDVLNSILTFDKIKEKEFSQKFYKKYVDMMDNIFERFTSILSIHNQNSN